MGLRLPNVWKRGQIELQRGTNFSMLGPAGSGLRPAPPRRTSPAAIPSCPDTKRARRLEYEQLPERRASMNKLLALFFLSAGTTPAQSPFDGTWIINWDTIQLPAKVSEYRLTAGMIHCVGCTANVSITTDGHDQKIPAGSYWDTASARIIDPRSVEITIKKAGKTLFTEIDTVSPDGRTLTQSVKDTTEAEAVTIDTLNRRVSNGPAGSHTISGTWRAYKENRSKNGSIINSKGTLKLSAFRFLAN